MKKNKEIILISALIGALVVLATALAIYLFWDSSVNNSKKPVVNAVGIQTFANQTENKQFQNVPLYSAEGVKLTEPEDRGDEVYMVTVNGTNKEQYEEYLKTLQKAGYKFFADNGKEGLDESIYTASFKGEKETVTVTYYAKEESAYITSSLNMELSPHLIDREEYKKSALSGRKNTLYMFELYDFGNSFVVQLKNGHFIVSDGGTADDSQYLIDYLEEYAPNGEKPVIEAWFITHAHGDHQGALAGLAENPELLSRIYIDGIYLSMPSDEAFLAVNQLTSKTDMMMIQTLPNTAMASDGTSTKLYRPQSGQKYYFCDVVLDIMHTQENLVTQDYANLDLNDSSTWTMFNMDGQKFLLAGDADKGSMRVVMKNFSKEYLKLDVYASFHHNLNNWLPFMEYSEIKTTLFTTSGTESQNKQVGEINSVGSNQYLKDTSKDYYSWEDGGKILTFPYEIGSAKDLPVQTWKYHEERERSYE